CCVRRPAEHFVQLASSDNFGKANPLPAPTVRARHSLSLGSAGVPPAGCCYLILPPSPPPRKSIEKTFDVSPASSPSPPRSGGEGRGEVARLRFPQLWSVAFGC